MYYCYSNNVEATMIVTHMFFVELEALRANRIQISLLSKNFTEMLINSLNASKSC